MWDLATNLPTDGLLAFLAAAIVPNLTPGPDVLFATTCGLRGGPSAGAAAGLGTALGSLWHVSLSAFGLSALLIAMPGALTGLKWLGAAYLLVLAYQSWTAARAEPANGAAFGMTPRTALRRAFVINAANPKVALFMLAFLPQFTQPALGPIWPQIVFLGLIVTVTGGSVTSAYGFLAGFLGATLARRMSVLNRLAAGMLVILALSFAFQ